ncbi:unnamed protein product [Prunus brigantina]
MPSLFYQRYWDIVGQDVSDLCLRVLNGSDGVNEFNHTLVALIPKVCSPTRISEYRPISLCNVLYKIISKTLANILKKVLLEAERGSRLQGVSIAHSAPSINHLFFAKDSLLFCNAGTTEALELKCIFGVYEAASRQKVNLEKSALCFSPSTPRVLQEGIRQFLNVSLVPCHERYLGLPTIVGKDKKKLFRTVKDRVWNKMNGWQGKLLSKAGKEVLI